VGEEQVPGVRCQVSGVKANSIEAVDVLRRVAASILDGQGWDHA
jgi:hypothetical protein